MEEELQLIESDLFAFTKKVEIMEMPTCDLCQRHFTRKTNREEYMEIILTIASKMSKLYTSIPDMEAILKYEIMPKNPYDAVS